MNRNKQILTATVLALVLIIGGIIAYFSDYDEGTANFTMGSVKIELSNPIISLNDEDLGYDFWVPNQTIDSSELLENISVTNVGSNDAYVFVEVVLPTIDNAYLDYTDSGLYHQVTGKTNVIDIDAVGTNWVDVTDQVLQNSYEEQGIDFPENHRLFAYASNIENMTALSSGLDTSELLEMLKVTNFREDANIENADFDIEVYAYAIQADALEGNVKTAKGVWDLLMADRWSTSDPNSSFGIIDQ